MRTPLVALAVALATTSLAAAQGSPPQSITLSGVVRDFKERTVAGGHADFERAPTRGFGLYCGNVALTLDSDRKPVFVGGGRRVYSQWRTANSTHFIAPHMFQAGLGDVAGFWGPYDSGGVTSAESFSQWFRDVPGVNLSRALDIELTRQASGLYVFDSATTAPYSTIGGFFPIDNELFGNSAGEPQHNYHFTYEIRAEFVYDAGSGQVFTFTGDDDVYVFINEQLVVDLGGVHGVTTQSVLIDRLGLADGETYRLDFFFAERHRTQSNFRITTNMILENVAAQTISAAYD